MLDAECARALRQPERLLRDPRLLAEPVEAWEEVRLSDEVVLEQRGAARWGPRGANGELPAAPGVWRYVAGLDALERVEGEAPTSALTLHVKGAWGEDTLSLWEEGGAWRARSEHTGATVRVGGDVRGAVEDLSRLLRQVREGALARPQLSDPDHAIGGR